MIFMKAYQCECGWMIYTDSQVMVICGSCKKPNWCGGEKASVSSQKPDTEKEQRRKRVAEATRAKERLISWLRLFRTPTELGVGDTAHRIVQIVKRKSDAHTLIKRLLSQYSCSRHDAVTKLNQKWPY